MKRSVIILLTFVGLACTVASCSKDDDKDYMMSNQDFVTQASSSNMFEIAAGQLAVSKGTNTNVVAFGNHMVSDHGKTAAEMATLAQQKGWTIPTTMLQKHQANIATLSSLSGTAFDKQFAAMMVVSHQEAITLFSNGAQENGVPDGGLRAFAAGKLPNLQDHLKEAQTLQAQVGQ